ncbi:hypothetical protein A3C37_02555 [Candidatus Peribacteria bacterium RIFCSPHIGHO2_02_FULL_53_20]|nr:MAG: hypothetical protein A3C37_02555 [Candidatus Peribacteria bacterium RIFCSPHIGHO2_02_FULL_53_20]
MEEDPADLVEVPEEVLVEGAAAHVLLRSSGAAVSVLESPAPVAVIADRRFSFITARHGVQNPPKPGVLKTQIAASRHVVVARISTSLGEN